MFENRNTKNAVVKVKLTQNLSVTKVIPAGTEVALELLTADLNGVSFKARTADGGETTLNNNAYRDMVIVAKSGEELNLAKLK